MKRALGMTAAVTGYVVVEILLLLSVIVPDKFNEHEVYRTLVLWSQFLLIPGFAALFSRIIYGPRKWGRRTLVILLFAPLGLCIFITPFFVLAILLDWTFIVSKILFAMAMSAVFGAMVIGFRWCLRRLTRWSTESEVERWLAERQKRNATYERKCRNRGVRVASLVPAIAVLLVFLFLPEIWGILSHLNQRQLENLSGYQVKIPETWIVSYKEDARSDGSYWANGFTGRGIGRGGDPFRNDALSYWRVGTSSFNQSERTDYDRWPPTAAAIINRRIFALANERIECTDYWSHERWGLTQSEAATVAQVSCDSTGRFRASSYGSRRQLAEFYGMLGQVKQVP